jgi:hypothetical protein
MKALVFAFAVVAACSDLPPSESTLEILPAQFAPAQDSAAALAQARAVAADSSCVPLRPTRVSVTGVLRREVHLGPPGYGETPSHDERDTILVVELLTSIPVCPDFAQNPRDTVARVQRLQLTGPASEGFKPIGSRVRVYGSLTRAVRGTDFLPVVLWADSIPGLRLQLRSSS